MQKGTFGKLKEIQCQYYCHWDESRRIDTKQQFFQLQNKRGWGSKERKTCRVAGRMVGVLVPCRMIYARLFILLPGEFLVIARTSAWILSVSQSRTIV